MPADALSTRCRRSATGPAGTAMAETVLVLPLIVAVLSLMIFFGWAMRRLDQVVVLDRYEAWREVTHAPGPAPVGEHTSELNQTFFAGRAQRITLAGQIAYPSGARQTLLDDAARMSVQVGQLAQSALSHFPRTREVAEQTTQNSQVPFWQQFAGPLGHHHVRLDNEWKYVNRLHLSPDDEQWHPVAKPTLTLAPSLRQVFFPTLDGQLTSLAGSGNPIARSMKDAYALEPPYVGPKLPAAWQAAN